MIWSFNYADCEYGKEEWGVYANTADKYWTNVDYQLENMVDHLDIWNDQFQDWNITIVNEMTNTEDYFR